MLLQVVHETLYRYRPMVETAQHVAYMLPKSHAAQTVLESALHIDPTPDQHSHMTDVFGNTRYFFSLQSPHTTLCVIARSVVETRASDPVESTISWEKTRERFRYQAGELVDIAAEFVFPSPFVPRLTEFANYARPHFRAATPLLDACVGLMQRIHADFRYESQSTQINTPALEAFEARRGVCQDFAHIMIACLRSTGLAARYVSGYLLTEPAQGQTKLLGSDATHAWVSVYLPDLPQGARWVDFDPTNNRWGWHAPGPDYVTVATGRDFGDVSPLRGVIYGGASHTLTVGVTVQSINENSATAFSQNQGQSQNQHQSQSQSQF
jgi:transglutaminase-like putative cysteine protease